MPLSAISRLALVELSPSATSRLPSNFDLCYALTPNDTRKGRESNFD